MADVDNLLGGGLPLGTVLLLGSEGDGGQRDNGNATTLLKYFLAEGCASGHSCLWMPPEAGPRPAAHTLPRVVVPAGEQQQRAGRSSSSSSTDDNEGKAAGAGARTGEDGGGGDGLRIAWQYRRYLQQGKALDD